jgi:hypothetical protein
MKTLLRSALNIIKFVESNEPSSELRQAIAIIKSILLTPGW